MKKLLAILCLFCGIQGVAHADDTAFFKLGPLALNVPFKSVSVTYLFDFHANESLVGGETPIASLFDNPATEAFDPRIEGVVGAVTSLQGQGTPFVGGNILVGNLVDKWVSLPSDLKIGGYGGWNFHTEAPIYGLKASIAIW